MKKDELKNDEPLAGLKLKVVGVQGDGEATRDYSYTIRSITHMGTELKVSPKAAVTINDPGFKLQFIVPTVNIVVNIGDNHTADIVMSKAAWDALNNNAKVSVPTVKKLKSILFNE